MRSLGGKVDLWNKKHEVYTYNTFFGPVSTTWRINIYNLK